MQKITRKSRVMATYTTNYNTHLGLGYCVTTHGNSLRACVYSCDALSLEPTAIEMGRQSGKQQKRENVYVDEGEPVHMTDPPVLAYLSRNHRLCYNHVFCLKICYSALRANLDMGFSTTVRPVSCAKRTRRKTTVQACHGNRKQTSVTLLAHSVFM